jgi:hypothetical protein
VESDGSAGFRWRQGLTIYLIYRLEVISMGSAIENGRDSEKNSNENPMDDQHRPLSQNLSRTPCSSGAEERFLGVSPRVVVMKGVVLNPAIIHERNDG